MEVQETSIKTQMKLFHRVIAKHKSYYPCIKSFEKNPLHSQNGSNSISRHDFLLKFSVKTQSEILFSEKNCF